MNAVNTNSLDEVLVCFAMNHEAAPYKKALADRPGIHVLMVGIGPRNAEAAIRGFLGKTMPSVVLTCGLAGGLRSDLAFWGHRVRHL